MANPSLVSVSLSQRAFNYSTRTSTVPLYRFASRRQEVRLFTGSQERQRYDTMADFYALFVAMEHLEKAYVRDAVLHDESVDGEAHGSNLETKCLIRSFLRGIVAKIYPTMPKAVSTVQNCFESAAGILIGHPGSVHRLVLERIQGAFSPLPTSLFLRFSRANGPLFFASSTRPQL